MPDETLHGNHDPCPACELRRENIDTRAFNRPAVECNRCGGKGYLPLTATEITRRTAAEARRTYWPEFERRIREAAQ